MHDDEVAMAACNAIRIGMPLNHAQKTELLQADQDKADNCAWWRRPAHHTVLIGTNLERETVAR